MEKSCSMKDKFQSFKKYTPVAIWLATVLLWTPSCSKREDTPEKEVISRTVKPGEWLSRDIISTIVEQQWYDYDLFHWSLKNEIILAISEFEGNEDFNPDFIQEDQIIYYEAQRINDILVFNNAPKQHQYITIQKWEFFAKDILPKILEKVWYAGEELSWKQKSAVMSFLLTYPENHHIKSFDSLGGGESIFFDTKSLVQYCHDQHILKKQIDPNIIDVSQIAWSPWEREGKTTACSKSARLNAEAWGVKIPRGESAFASRKMPLEQEHLGRFNGKPHFSTFVDMNKEIGNLAPWANCAEIYTDALLKKNKKYGHRSWMYLDEADGMRYVLDPYTIKGKTKIVLSEFNKKRPILEIVFYKGKRASSNPGKKRDISKTG